MLNFLQASVFCTLIISSCPVGHMSTLFFVAPCSIIPKFMLKILSWINTCKIIYSRRLSFLPALLNLYGNKVLFAFYFHVALFFFNVALFLNVYLLVMFDGIF